MIRAAEPGDASAIAETIRGGFSAELLELFIYGCAGIARYVAAQITARARGGDTVYNVAERGSELVGCAELRVLPDTLFLNYVAVAPDERRTGLGNRLLADAIRRARGPLHETLALDVLEDNSPALAWYAGLGLERRSTTEWWAVPVDVSAAAPARLVLGLPQAEAVHAAYGFSRVTLAGAGDAGVLGDRWFRVTDARALADPGVHAALHALDPARGIIALLAEGELPAAAAPRARRITATHRLTGDLGVIAARLAERLGERAR